MVVSKAAIKFREEGCGEEEADLEEGVVDKDPEKGTMEKWVVILTPKGAVESIDDTKNSTRHSHRHLLLGGDQY